ncbi:MAG: GTPase domain-containing protein [Planctomycetaceae bacterium]|nr:GTPase domain-containing protein [Planctomycetaceae bacterium]
MNLSEINHLEVLSAIDELRERTVAFTGRRSDWAPVARTQTLLKRVLDRVETLRIRMEAPLVVATFGGTGTGKSSLVNALVGEECTRSGRQRPTTRQPIIIAHPRTDLPALGIPLHDVQVMQREADILRDIVIIDCPDPDSDEQETSGSNLERLHELLPFCDVLLYVSTQQKYRSARVSDELLKAAQGCRIIFVQTHADLDTDIRDDWAKSLSGRYEVPDLFFVDSVKALQEQQAGQRPSGEMGRLVEMLTHQLGTSERVGVRRANVVDLLQAALARSQEQLQEQRPKLEEVGQALVTQREALVHRMAGQLQEELLSSRNLWERRLVGSVCDTWGLSPFSAVLRGYNGLGTILASMTFYRARSTAQLALLGAVQGVRWLEGFRQEREAEATLTRVSQFGLDDSLLREAEIVMEGHVQAAGLSRELMRDRSLEDLRREAAAVEGQFADDARRRIDEIIRDLAQRNSRWYIRGWYEILFLAYLAFVLFRVGKNFFYESFIESTPLLSSDFYIAAGLFLVLWTGLLVMLFTRRLRRGLQSKVKETVQQLVETRLARGLFPQVDRAVREALGSCDDVDSLLALATQVRQDIATPSQLGGQRIERNATKPAVRAN